MKVYLITGNHPRNTVLSEKLKQISEVDIVGQLVFAREPLVPKPPVNLRGHIRDLWIRHFDKREVAENRYFGKSYSPAVKAPTRHVADLKGFNSLESVNHLHSCNPDIVLITGAPIIKDPLFSGLPAYSINLHLGLIPDYKGSITMFWPFYFLEPTMAGCTYHVIDRLVDTGCILHQTVPELRKGDGLFDVASRASLTAVDDLHLVLKAVSIRLENGIIPRSDPTLQTKGKLFKQADWKPDMLVLNYDIFEDRMADYVLEGQIKCRQPRLIQIDVSDPR